MRRLAELITRDADLLAETETRDTGKLLREMRGQLGSIPDWFIYFAGLADKLQGETIPVDKPNFLVYTRHEPAGVVGAIVPWNSPLLLLCWKLAPALAAGCTLVAKPSDYSPALRGAAGRAAGRGRVPAGRVQRGHRVRARRSARRWRHTRGWTRSRSPGPPRSARRWPRRPRRTSPAWCWSSAASRRTSCSMTPTWTRSATAWWPGCSPPPGRPAWPGPGCWCTAACTTRWSRGSWPGRKPSGSVTRGTRPPRWGRWPPSRSTARCCRSSTGATAEGATVATGGQPDRELGGLLRAPDRAHRT